MDIPSATDAITVLSGYQQHIEELTRHSRTLYWECDAAGLYKFVGENVEDMTGYAPADVVGKLHFYDWHPEEGREIFKVQGLQAMQGKASFADLLNPIERRDGSVMWVLTNGLPILDKHGDLLGYRGSDRDVTELRRAQEALAESEARYRTIFDGAAQGLLMADIQSMRFVYANPTICRMLGYTSEEFLQLTPLDIHPPEEADLHRANFQPDAEGTVRRAEDVLCIRKDGTTLPVDITAREVTYQGRPHLIGFITDMSEKKRMEAMLLKAQAMAKVGSWEVDLAARTVVGTPEFYRIHELAPAKVGLDLLVTAGLEEARAEFQRSITDRTPYHGVYPLEFPDGRTKWIEVHGENEYDAAGNPVRFIGTTQDITAQRATNERLRLQSAALEAAANAIVITDPCGRVEWCNTAFFALTGYSAEESIGALIQDLQLAPGTGTAEQYAEAFECLYEGKAWSGELTHRRKDGSTYPESVTVTPLCDASGQLLHCIAIKEDISQRRALEAQLLQAQKMESIGRLAGGVAHDFNNLLSIIIGYGEALAPALAHDPQLASDLGEVIRAAERGAGLARQLLAFGRRQIMQPAVLLVVEVVRDAEKMLRRLLPENIELRLRAEPCQCAVLADRGQLEQVLMNLAVNARDAMPNGGMLTIHTACQHIRGDEVIGDTRLPAGVYSCIRVTDTGTGIPPEALPRIFEPFFTTKEVGKGSGLGLSTVYGIVRQSGGHVSVTSTYGAGASFQVFLPILTPTSPTPVVKSAAPKPLRGSETIALVEDDVVVRKLLQRGLEHSGFRVVSYAHPADAMAMADADLAAIDLLVTDVIMPGANGVEVAGSLCSRQPALKVLFVTGYADDAFNGHLPTHAGRAILRKPFGNAALVTAIRTLLDDGVGSGE